MTKVGLIFSLLLSLAGLMSCSSTEEKPTDEISLKADRKILDKYRDEIPEEIRDENDFMALVLKDMAEMNIKPQDVRNRYYKEVRGKRNAFNKQHRRMRDNFTREEKKKRNEFLKEMKEERTAFISTKPKSKESSEFFQQQNVKRSAYFQDQRDKRKEFESQMDASRKDFNDDMKLKQKQFDDAYREYLKNYQEKRKQKKLQALTPKAPPNSQISSQRISTGSYPGQANDLQEFSNFNRSGRQILKADDN